MSDPRQRDNKGRFEASHDITAEDFLTAMDALEPYTTRELADALGVPRRTAYEVLDGLATHGAIRKKKPEPRRAIWIRPEDTP
ncbi:helix-turn-helix domain-containing protein [Halomarina pelagica]|uniref:helix-turn-helix domain-containing protein n=1 Tax=Halomarina pelagica TaxID=2961599 RepID=UPI0020C44722|nr:helix-turn-helix domain-containing protein [Halomarina sp. BND7]